VTLSDNTPSGVDPSQPISRRSLLTGLSAIAISPAITLLHSQRAFSEESASEGAPTAAGEATAWAQSADPDSGKILFVSKTIRMKGDWKDTQLLSGIAWGDGHEGSDIWTSNPNLVVGNSYKLRFTGILPHPVGKHEWYFTIMLEIADATSDRIGAMFRYIQGQGHHGVFTASFCFPAKSGLTDP